MTKIGCRGQMPPIKTISKKTVRKGFLTAQRKAVRKGFLTANRKHGADKGVCRP